MKRVSLIIAALCVLALAAGCASMPAPAAEAPAAPASTRPPAESYAYDGYAAEEAPYPQEPEGSGLTELPLLAPDNDIGVSLSYTVELRLQTTSFMAGIRTLNNTVAEMKGYTVHASIQGRDLFRPEFARQASYDYKIPSENLAKFLMAMEDNYNLLYMEQNAEDITTEQERADSRLEQLEQRQTSLQAELNAAKAASDRQRIEQELAEVRAELNSLRAKSREMERKVVYSTVSITLYEVIPPAEAATLTWGERLQQTGSNTAGRFAAMGQGLVLFFISALPVLVMLAVLGGVAWVVYRAVKKRRASHAGQETPDREKTDSE